MLTGAAVASRAPAQPGRCGASVRCQVTPQAKFRRATSRHFAQSGHSARFCSLLGICLVWIERRRSAPKTPASDLSSKATANAWDAARWTCLLRTLGGRRAAFGFQALTATAVAVRVSGCVGEALALGTRVQSPIYISAHKRSDAHCFETRRLFPFSRLPMPHLKVEIKRAVDLEGVDSDGSAAGVAVAAGG